MRKFNLNNLCKLTKTVYEHQQKWVNRNWETTLAAHNREINVFLERIDVFDLWKGLLKGKFNKAIEELIPEIFIDCYMSVHFASMGLYKQAHVCLRAQLETTLRLVYFSTHQIEFNWWYNGNRWYLDTGAKDVWGHEYKYFEQLENIKIFEKKCGAELFKNLRNLYKTLSQYVHTSAQSFQTRTDRISPKYNIDEFKKWATNFRETQKYVNTILILGFAEMFKSQGVDTQRKMLKAVENGKYKDGIRKSLGLRIRGRV